MIWFRILAYTTLLILNIIFGLDMLLRRLKLDEKDSLKACEFVFHKDLQIRCLRGQKIFNSFPF